MYGYYQYVHITPKQLLQKVDQKKVFELVFKIPIDLNEKYNSPFRNDRNPGCWFEEMPNGTILFMDFSDRKGHTHRTCIKAIMDYFDLSLSDSINFICHTLDLPKDARDYPVSTINTVEQEEKAETIITYNKRDFEKRDKLYWSQFLIKVEELEKDNVFAVQSYRKINHKGSYTSTPYGLCYAIDFLNHAKLYSPYSNKKTRWITNCDSDDVGNIDNLPFRGDRLIITKSYKDHRTLRNVLEDTNIIWLQSEGALPSEYILVNLLARFEEIVIFFDNDYPGFKQAYRTYNILKKLGNNIIRIVYLPIRCKYKDPAEYAKEGRIDLLKMLKQIGL